MGNFDFPKVWGGGIPIGGWAIAPPLAPMVATALRQSSEEAKFSKNNIFTCKLYGNEKHYNYCIYIYV